MANRSITIKALKLYTYLEMFKFDVDILVGAINQ